MRKRSTRRPYQQGNTLLVFNQVSQPLSGTIMDKLRTQELSSIHAFKTGKASVGDLGQLRTLCEITLHMAKAGIGPEAIPTCEAAWSELEAAVTRAMSVGKLGLSGPGIRAVEELYEFHDAQRNAVSWAEYSRHIEDLKRRVKKGKVATAPA